MPFRMVSGVGQGMGVLDAMVIIEGKGQLWGWIWGIPLSLMGNFRHGSSQITSGNTCFRVQMIRCKKGEDKLPPEY